LTVIIGNQPAFLKVLPPSSGRLLNHAHYPGSGPKHEAKTIQNDYNKQLPNGFYAQGSTSDTLT